MHTTLAAKLAHAGQTLPVLKTERLTLRPFVFEDAKDVFDYAKDELTALYTTFSAHTSLEDSYYFLFEIVLASYLKGDLGPYAIDLDGKVIGAIELRTIPSPIRNHAREIGIILNTHYRGKGYMNEASKALIRYAFNETPIYRIFGCIEEDNKDSVRTLEKLGFTYEGRERHGRTLKGQYVDLLHYSILKPEWAV